MRFCSRFNITWSLQKLKNNDFFNINVEKQEFTGQARFLITKYLLLRRDDELHEVKKHCLFIKSGGVGQDESLALLKNETADANIRPTNYFHSKSESIRFVGVFKTEQYNVYQSIDSKPSSSSKQIIEVFLSLDRLLIGCLLLYLASFAIACLIRFFGDRNKPTTSSKLIANFLDTFLAFRPDKTTQKPSFVGIITIAFALFQFFVQNLILNSISSSTVVIDLSHLITSIDQMFERNRKVCFGEKGPESGFFEFAPNNTVPHRIFNQLDFANSPCYLFNEGKFNLSPYLQNSYFALLFRTTGRTIRNLMHVALQRNAFFYERSFFEILRTIGVRKSLPEHLRNNIDECLKFMVEHGLITELYKQAEVFFNSKFKHDYRTFFTVKEYLEDYTSVMNLKLQNFRLLFELYLAMQVVLCAVFGLCALVRFWNERTDLGDLTVLNDRTNLSDPTDRTDRNGGSKSNNRYGSNDQIKRNDQNVIRFPNAVPRLKSVTSKRLLMTAFAKSFDESDESAFEVRLQLLSKRQRF